MTNIKKVFLVLTTLLILALPTWAYNGQVEDIVVSGTASREYHPDTAYVDFTILGIAKTPDGATTEVNLKSHSLEQALQVEAQALGSMESNHYSLQPLYNDKGKITSYQAHKSIRYAVSDPAKAGYFIDLLLAAGVDQINKVNFTVKNPQALSNQLLKEAVENARLRAELVATASGRSLGRLLHMTIYNSPTMDNHRYYTKSMASEATVLEPTDVKISVQVEATYALE